MVKYSSFDSPKILSSVNNDDDVGYDDKKLILERTQFLLALVMSQMLSSNTTKNLNQNNDEVLKRKMFFS